MDALGDGLLQPLSFSTESVRRQDQFEYWRHKFEHVTDLRPAGPRSAGYKAKCRIYNIRNFVIVQLSRPGCIIEHSSDAIRANNIDHWMISAFHRGRGTLRAFHRERPIEPGQPVRFVLRRGKDQSENPTAFMRRISCSVSAGFLNGSCFSSQPIEKSGLTRKVSSKYLRASSVRPSFAQQAAR